MILSGIFPLAPGADVRGVGCEKDSHARHQRRGGSKTTSEKSFQWGVVLVTGRESEDRRTGGRRRQQTKEEFTNSRRKNIDL